MTDETGMTAAPDTTPQTEMPLADAAGPALSPQIAPGSPLEAMRATAPEAAEALRREWGADFDANIGHARAVAEAFADDEVRTFLNETGLGDDPRIVRLAARIGRALQESAAATADDANDPAGPSAGGGSRRPRALIQAEIDRLTRDEHYWSAPVQERVRGLYLELHGGGSLAVHRAPGDGGAQW